MFIDSGVVDYPRSPLDPSTPHRSGPSTLPSTHEQPLGQTNSGTSDKMDDPSSKIQGRSGTSRRLRKSLSQSYESIYVLEKDRSQEREWKKSRGKKEEGRRIEEDNQESLYSVWTLYSIHTSVVILPSKISYTSLTFILLLFWTLLNLFLWQVEYI